MGNHYICTGNCQGVSQVPGTCQTEDCDRYHEKLLECNCTDGKHKMVLEGDQDKKFNPDDEEIL